MSFEAFSNLEESLKVINSLHWESGNEAHSKMGFRFKKKMEASLRSKKTTFTIKMVTVKQGKNKGKTVRRIVKTAPHRMGDRFDKNGNLLSSHMGNFIQWRTYSTTGMTVVGGLMKPGTTELRENGKIVGKTRVYGVRQVAVDILEKMSTGKTGLAVWYTKNRKPSTKSMKKFEGTHERKPNNFIRDGKTAAVSGYKENIERWARLALARRVKYTRDQKKLKKVA